MRFRLTCLAFIFSVTAVLGSPLRAEEAAASQATDDSPSTVKEQVAADAKTYDLRYQFTLGQVVRLLETYQAQMDVAYKQAKQSDTNSAKTWKHYTVTSVAEDGSGTLQLQIDKAHLKAKFGNTKEIVFRSDDPNFHPRKFRDMLAQIGKVTAQIEYSPHGKLLKVVDPSGKQKVAARNRSPKDHQGFMVPLPEEPVAVGAKWKDPFKQEVGLDGGLKRQIDLVRFYQLKSVEGNLANISFSTAIVTPVNNGRILAQLIQKQIEGTIILDLDKKLIVKKIVTVNKTVINPFGPGSSMRAVTSLTEQLQPEKVVAENKIKQAAAAKKN